MNIHITWEGEGVNERGISDDGKILVKVNKKFFRPLESDNYLADPSKARKILKWTPSIGFRELVKIMVENDMKLKS